MRELDLVHGPLTGRHLIEASAGTGKTFALAHLYLRLVLERSLTVDRILVVTFTDAATAELRDRIHTLLAQALDRCRDTAGDADGLVDTLLAQAAPGACDRLERALYDFDDAAVCTIHGFCHRVLLDNAFETGALFDTMLLPSQEDLLIDAAQDFWRVRCLDHGRLFTGFLLDSRCSVVSLMKALGRRSVQPALHLVPQQTRCPDTADLEAAFLGAYENVRAAWEAYGETVSNYLAAADGPKRNIYTALAVGEGLAQMRRLVTMPPDSPSFMTRYDRFHLFTSEKLLASLKKSAVQPPMDLFDTCQALADAAAELADAYALRLKALKHDFVTALRTTLRERKEALHAKSFDDLLTDLDEVLRRGADGRLATLINRRYQAALIDEFQDTDQVQYAIFSRVFSSPESTLFLIGDPKQAIYGFRGADVFTYMQAKSEADDDRRSTLLVNHRADPGLVTAVNSLFCGHPSPFVFDGIPFAEAVAAENPNRRTLMIDGRPPTPLHVWFLPGAVNGKGGEDAVLVPVAGGRLAQAIAAECSHILTLADRGEASIGETPVRPADIAVLVRTHAQADLVREALAACGIPAVMHGMGSVYESVEADDLLRVMAAVMAPNNERLARAAITTHMLGISGDSVAALADDDARMAETLERFTMYNRLWSTRGFAAMSRRMAADYGVSANLLRYRGGERALTNVVHLTELLQAKSAGGMGMQELVGWLARQQLDPLHRDDEAHELRLDSDDNAVTIVTIHRAKGLQYPIVFCPFTCAGSDPRADEALFHDEANGRRLTYDYGSDGLQQARRLAARELLAENVRLLYVALTRAKCLCYTAWGKVNESWTSAPAYLLHGRQLGADESVVERLREHVKRLSSNDVRSALEEVSVRSHGTVAVEELTSANPVAYVAPSTRTPDIVARRFARHLEEIWGVASFSSLVHGHRDDHETAEHDETPVEVVPEPAPEQTDDSMFSFPRGARAGSCLHRLLELADFSAARPADHATAAATALAEFRFEQRWAPTVTSLVGRVADTSLADSLVLRHVKPAQRLNELEFYFPLRTLAPADLRDLFAACGAALSPADIPGTIDRLQFRPLEGYMHGYIDCVCSVNDRYYLLDWKSNYLGGALSDYSRAHLDRAMTREYYFLQYHIYAVALHRFLAARLPTYEYDRHFGGAVYVFLRGIAPESPSGVFADRPSRALIETLSSTLIGPLKRSVA